MPRTVWEYLNAPLIAGLIQSIATAFVGGLIVSLLVGLTVAWVAGQWQEERKRREIQLGTFKDFNRQAADVIVRLTDLYHARDVVPDAPFQATRREVASRKLLFLQMDAELAVVFRDQTLFEDLLKAKQAADGIQQAATGPQKAPLHQVEPLQQQFLDVTKIMRLKMAREIGVLSEEEFNRGIERLNARLKTLSAPKQ